ncbi:MAG TPA: P-II family nitrogen regulator [Acidimicrobiales bacterium]|jgi:nitrogen regulatory protein P-II 1|nr:P-II family nitrogen regulator [Acidimicrobiales bacterium]
MKKVEAVFRPERLENVAASLDAAGFHGFTITDARGHGRSAERTGEWRGVSYEMLVTHKLAITVVVEDGEVDAAVAAICAGAATGAVGDGLVSVSELTAVFPIRDAQGTGAAAPS